MYSVLDSIAISSEDVCCSVVFNNLVGVFVLSVIWSGLLMTSAISCPLWLLVYECLRVECAFTFPVRTECGMFMMCCIQCCMSANCIVVCGCAVSRRYIHVCNRDVFSVVNMYLDHFRVMLLALMVEGMFVFVNVMLSLMSVMGPSPALCNLSVRTVVKLCTF